MRKHTNKFTIIFLFTYFSMLSCTQPVKVAEPVEGLTTSDLFEVYLGDDPVWTEKFTSNMDTSKLPEWFSEPYVREVQEMHIADFDFSQPQTLKVHVLQNVENVVVRPLSRDIKVEIRDNQFTIDFDQPGYLVVEVDDLPPLFIFANSPEKDEVSEDDENVLYFGPGTHRPGYIDLQDNQTVYLAKGAVVYGGLRGDSVTGVTIKGRGILDGNFEFKRMVTFDNSSDITVEGIMIRNSNGWTNTITNCDNVNYRGVKVISFGPGGDGINPLNSRNVEISGCFLRCTDDCIAIKSPHYGPKSSDITVQDNIMIGYAYSDGVTIGFETNEDISDVLVKNCDILLSRGGSRVEGGHSGFSIICDGPGVISNIKYENIRVEKAENKLFELNITDGEQYGIDPPGHIRNISLTNIHWLHRGPIVFKGQNEDHIVENVVLQHCKVGDKDLIEVAPQVVEYNQFTKDLAIVQNGEKVNLNR